MEEVGDEYFNELVSRSFFQRSSGGESIFVMHDLVHDLAKFVSGELHFGVEDDNSHQILEKTRHLSKDMISPDLLWNLETNCKSKGLRTFFLPSWFDFDSRVTLDVIVKLRCLRVLCLSNNYNFNELPDSIGTLRHLRYLNLSNTSIVKLPESINALYNLQTLKLFGCSYLKKLPMDMHKLINLRYLDVSGCSYLEEMPHVSKLKSLQILCTFIVGKDNGVKIRELGLLSNLRGKLHITKLRNVVNAKDASEAKLKDKKYLEELQLEYNDDAKTEDSLLERDVLEKLEPHTNLKKLGIENYGGTRFPDWLGDHSFCNMVSLRLENCKNCCILPPLGQLPSLKVVHVIGFDGVQTIGPEFYRGGSFVTKPFPSLEILNFNGMHAWQECCCFEVEDEGRVFPCLRDLQIIDCPSLKILDNMGLQHLTSLKTLEISDCPNLQSLPQGGLPSSLTSLRISTCPLLQERCVRKKGEDWPKIAHIPSLLVSRVQWLERNGSSSSLEEGSRSWTGMYEDWISVGPTPVVIPLPFPKFIQDPPGTGPSSD